MKLIVDEKTQSLKDNNIFVNEYSFNYDNGETGGQLYNGTLFVSNLDEKAGEANINFLRQVDEDKFEAYKTEKIKLNEVVEVKEIMSEVVVVMRFALVN